MYHAGDQVYYWHGSGKRKPGWARCWYGPVAVIGFEEQNVLLVHRHATLKVPPFYLRHAQPSERLPWADLLSGQGLRTAEADALDGFPSPSPELVADGHLDFTRPSQKRRRWNAATLLPQSPAAAAAAGDPVQHEALIAEDDAMQPEGPVAEEQHEDPIADDDTTQPEGPIADDAAAAAAAADATTLDAPLPYDSSDGDLNYLESASYNFDLDFPAQPHAPQLPAEDELVDDST